jgi:hypothetical protein
MPNSGAKGLIRERTKQLFSSSLQGNGIAMTPNTYGAVYRSVGRFQRMSCTAVIYRSEDKLMR